MTDKQYKRLVLRGIWAILFTLCRIAVRLPNCTLSNDAEDIEIELRREVKQ